MLNIIKKDQSIKNKFDAYIKKENSKIKLDIKYDLFDYEDKIVNFLKASNLFNSIVRDKDKTKKIYISYYSSYDSPYTHYINIENSEYSTICILVISSTELLNGFNLENSYFKLFNHNNRNFYQDKSKKKSISYWLMLNVYEHKYKDKITKQIKEVSGIKVRFNDLFYYYPYDLFFDFYPLSYRNISDLEKHPIETQRSSHYKLDYSYYREKTHFIYDNIRSSYLEHFLIRNKQEFKDIFVNFRIIRKYFKKLGINASVHLGSFDKTDVFIQLEINGIKDTFTIPYNNSLYKILSNNISIIMDLSQLEKINVPTEYSLKELLLNYDEILEMEKLKRY